jgi:signal transduction histidine kinase/CheY-like chemotaxis protein
VRGRRDIAAAFAGASLGEALAGASSAADLVQRVVHHLTEALGADRASFAVPTDDGRHLLLTSEGTSDGGASLTTLSLSEPFPAARAIRGGEPLYLLEPAALGGGPDDVQRPRALACLPLKTGAGVGGALVLRFDTSDGFDERERVALSALASEVGQALERARLLDAVLTARKRLVVLAEASARLLEAGPDRAALLETAARSVSEACGDACLLDLIPGQHEPGPWTRMHHPEPSARTALAKVSGAVRSLADALRAAVLAAGDTVFWPVLDGPAFAARAPAAGPWLERHAVHGVVAAPLRCARDRPIGILAVLRHAPHAPYTADDRLLVEGLADRAAIAIAYQRLAARERAAARRQAHLAAAARAFSEAEGDLDEVRRTIAHRSAAGLSARVTLWAAAGEGLRPELLATDLASGGAHLDTSAEAAAAASIRTGHPASVRAGADGRTRNAMAVPLRFDGRIAGALSASRRAGRRAFRREDRRMLADLGVHAALALAHARKQRELEAERRRLAEILASAEGASRAKDEFIAMLSHELRNPLSPIVTALGLMRLRAPSAAQRERVVIERQVAHLVRLVDDLLDVSRVIRGKVRLDRRPVLLSDVVGRAVEQASPILEERRHTLVLDLAEGLHLEGDAHRLAQVVANLLTNAARYTDPGGRIVVRALAEEAQARLSVSDNGIGISSALLPRIFDLFVQGERALDRAPGGLGIGLTIVRSLVDLHGGRVSVESAGRGQGSTFTVWLPLAPGPASVAGLAEDPPRPSVARAVRVLVVDDNEDAADLLAEVLRARGHQVRVAFDGPTALAAVEEEPPSIALLDLGLPVMDGFELARRLRERLGPAAPSMVAVTGYGQEPDRRASAAAGFEAHLVKPVDLDHVCEVVDRLAGSGPAAQAG